MDHAAFRELAAGAFLDDLDPTERERLDVHLAGCPACLALGEQLDDVALDLALLVPDMAPPRSLHGAVFDALLAAGVTGTSHQSESTPTSTPEPIPIASARSGPTGGARSRWTTIVPLALAAGIGVIAIGLGGRISQLTQENAASVAATADAQAQIVARDGAMAVLVAPDHETARLTSEALAPNAAALAVFEPGTTRSYVMVADLPATPAGHVYQLWFADAAGVHPLGTYHYDGSGAFVAPFGVDLAASDAAMITLEHDGGAVGGPGPQVIFGTL
jgi:hypothetical protein